MSIQSTAAQNYISNLDNKPNDVILNHVGAASVFQFLRNSGPYVAADDKAIVATALVCKDWQANLSMVQERQEASNRLLHRMHLKKVHNELIEYRHPKLMVELFKRCQLSIAGLPVLDVGSTNRDFINWLRAEDMVQGPIVRFQDIRERSGIAFHIEGYVEDSRDISGVMAVFARYRFTRHTEELPGMANALWRVGMDSALNRRMEDAHEKRHFETDRHIGSERAQCPTCPQGMSLGARVSYETLSDLLTGRDPLFRIAQGYVPRILPPPAPSL